MDRDTYAKFADHYDRRWARFSARSHARVLEQLPARLTGQRLLDVGCGTGSLIAAILAGHPAMAAITGVDVSASMLAKAAEKLAGTPRAGKVTLVRQRGDALDFPRASFDVVVCANTFHYFKHPAATLRELRGILTPGGTLILEDYSQRSPLARYGEWAIRRYDPLHRRAYALPEASRLVADAGFTIARQADFPIDLLWRGWIITGQPHRPEWGDEGAGRSSLVGLDLPANGRMDDAPVTGRRPAPRACPTAGSSSSRAPATCRR